jgi:hypothetical protein
MEDSRMLPKPQIGQLVSLETYEGRLIIKSVSEDGGNVDLVSEADPSYELKDVPCLDLLLVQDYSAD